MKNHKRFLAPMDLWDVGTIEAWLEEKAAQGWILEKWGTYPRFERMEPRPCRVRLDPQGQRIQVEQEEADALYRDMGWRRACPVWDDYLVYYCFDSAAPDLYTDSASQAWAWEKLLKRTVRRNVLALLLLAVWTALQFDDLFSDNAVELFLRGMWAVWLFVVLYVGGELWRLARQITGVRRQRQRLEAGVPLERGDPARAIKRRKRAEVLGWTTIVLLYVFVAGLVGSQREMPLSAAPEPLPYVSMEVLAPEEAALPLDSSLYRESRSLLTDHREVSQFRWDLEASLLAEFDRVQLPILAEALYRERLANFLDAWPEVAVREVTDSRFDRAVVIDTGKNQCFIGQMGRAVLMERVRTDRDLSAHLDDFAAVLAEFQ